MLVFLLISVCISRPLIVAHRGYASVIPENSMEALLAAAYQGVDYVEFDIQITRDNQLVVIHDMSLDRVTNIEDFPEFKDRRTTIDGTYAFFVNTFTYEEIQKLTLRQNLVEGRISALDGYFKIPLLKEVIAKMIKFNQQEKGRRNPDKKLCGVLIEAKDCEVYRKYLKIEQGQMIVDLLEEVKDIDLYLPVFLHSFDYETIKLWKFITKYPTSFLSNLVSLPDTLENIKTQTSTVGVLLQALWQEKNYMPTQIFQELKNLEFQVMAWTFRDDQLNISKNSIEQYKIAQNCLQLDGIITEFASAAVNLILDNKGKQCELLK